MTSNAGYNIGIPYGQKIESIEKRWISAFSDVAAPDLTRYGFCSNRRALGVRRMDWARILAFVTGLVDLELLARSEYRGRRPYMALTRCAVMSAIAPLSEDQRK
jgi:hypothetical protein